MNDFICSKCNIRMNHIFLVKDLGICVYCEKKDIVFKILNNSYIENQWNDKK